MKYGAMGCIDFPRVPTNALHSGLWQATGTLFDNAAMMGTGEGCKKMGKDKILKNIFGKLFSLQTRISEF